MKTVDINGLGPIPRIGFGCMGMSEFYGETLNQGEANALLDQAVEGGIRLFDTADFYGDGQNETLLGQFLSHHGSELLIASKCGIRRGNETLEDGNFRRLFDGRPEWIIKACEASLKRLGRDSIDLFYLHRIDPKIPLEESVGALARLVEQGKVRTIGLCEATPEQIRLAHSVHPLSAIQTEYSIWSRDVESEILPTCRELGIAFVPYSPLGRGMVPARGEKTLHFANGDFRLTLQRATSENLERNADLVEYLYSTGDALGLTAFQVMLAWLLAQGDDILPIPGMRKHSNLNANLAAVEVELPADITHALSEAFGAGRVSGGRYTVNQSVAENQDTMKSAAAD